MKDYAKLAAIVALFVLGSASDTYARPPNHNERSLQRYHNMVERDARLQRQYEQRRRDHATYLYRQRRENDWIQLFRFFKGDNNND